MINRMTTQERMVRATAHVGRILTRYRALSKIIDNTNKPSTYAKAVVERADLKKQLKSMRLKLNNALTEYL